MARPWFYVGLAATGVVYVQLCSLLLSITTGHLLPRKGRQLGDGHCCDDAIDSSEDTNGGAGKVVSGLLTTGHDLPELYRQDRRAEPVAVAASNASFVATLQEEITPKPQSGEIPTSRNFFDILLSKDCLPADKKCFECLGNKKGATCKTCREVCSCYCKELCETKVEKKFVRKTISVTPPSNHRDPSRLVPRIVHQTWFEDITKERYPNFSRLVESWKRSGWDHRFYSNEAARKYISTHFPPEVVEAYDSIKPGAYKADLFRYCVLLVDGGVYADVDLLLETNLDAAVPDGIGFMTPTDEPGKLVGHRMCLWNGLIASAPGHPFLAKTIETTVNNIRNRFTSVDIDNMLCPDPELSVSHAFDTLFTTGPCVLGMSINHVLGRHPQTSFEAGDIISHHSDDLKPILPGRTVLLSQNKEDMGAHRFTWEEENLVVAATDMPDYDDRDKLEGNKKSHYSETHTTYGIYGMENVYIDGDMAGEDIQIVVKRSSDKGNAQGKIS